MGFVDNSRGAFLPSIQTHFNLDNKEAGFLFSLASLCSLLTTLTSPFWQKKLSLKTGLSFCILLIGISSLTLGVSGYFHNPGLIFLSAVIFGLAVGGIGIILNQTIDLYAPIPYKKQIYAGLHTMYGLSSLLPPIIITYFHLSFISWFSFFGVISILIFLFSLKLKISAPLKEQEHTPFNREAFVLGLFIASYVAAEVVFSSRLVSLLTEMNVANPGYYLSLFFLSLMLGRLLFAIKKIHFKNVTVLKISLMGSFIFMILGLNIQIVFLSFTGFFMAPFFPVAMDTITSRYEKTSQGLIRNIMLQIVISLAFYHYLYGVLAQLGGHQEAMLIVPILLIISLVVLVKKSNDLDREVTSGYNPNT